MTVVISMLRGVNVAGHHQIRMAAVRRLYQSLKLVDAQTCLQSGNVVFTTDERDLAAVAKRIQQGMEREFGFLPEVILRTSPELRAAVGRNPFAARRGLDPSKLLVGFTVSVPAAAAQERLLGFATATEEVRLDGREVYVYFHNGVGQAKLSWAAIEKTLNTPATARNWNTVSKLLVLAERMETAR